MSQQTPFNIVVLISGNGSNLQAIIDEIERGKLPVRLSAVISNRPNTFGLQRAKQHDIPTHVIDHRQYPDRPSFDRELTAVIDQYQPDLVVLAGFMRILTDDFVNHYLGRLINIHPSLLPKYQGLETHRRCLEAGDKQHGATVHFVIPELDNGPVILQQAVPVDPDDTIETLRERVHGAEHRIYPEAIRRIALGQVRFSNNMTYFGNHPITEKEMRL